MFVCRTLNNGCHTGVRREMKELGGEDKPATRSLVPQQQLRVLLFFSFFLFLS